LDTCDLPSLNKRYIPPCKNGHLSKAFITTWEKAYGGQALQYSVTLTKRGNLCYVNLIQRWHQLLWTWRNLGKIQWKCVLSEEPVQVFFFLGKKDNCRVQTKEEKDRAYPSDKKFKSQAL